MSTKKISLIVDFPNKNIKCSPTEGIFPNDFKKAAVLLTQEKIVKL